MKKGIVIAIIAWFMIGQLQAQIVTDRPDQSEGSSTVGKGNLQIESGLQIQFSGNTQSSSRQILAPANLLKYGIGKNVEIRLLSQFEFLKNKNLHVQGIKDIEIGTKIQLLKDESKNTEMALVSHLIVPTGTKELTNDKFGTMNRISISHSVNEKVGIGYNLGYNYFGEGKGDLTYTLVLATRINDKVGIYIEPYGEVANFEQFISNFDTGITYLANNNLQFDFSFGTGINTRMNYLSVGFGWLIHGKEGKSK